MIFIEFLGKVKYLKNTVMTPHLKSKSLKKIDIPPLMSETSNIPTPCFSYSIYSLLLNHLF